MKCCRRGCSAAFACNGLGQEPRRFWPFCLVSGEENKGSTVSGPPSSPLPPSSRRRSCWRNHNHGGAEMLTCSLPLPPCHPHPHLQPQPHQHQKKNSTFCKVSFHFPKTSHHSNNRQEMLVSLGTEPTPPIPHPPEFTWKVEVRGRSGSRLLSLAAESESRDYFGAKGPNKPPAGSRPL